ncbi:MAG: hypothetical protein Q7U99_09825 [Rubrivivax sp.]|nr:hypothetical protein [Rubrivivax sp.]
MSSWHAVVAPFEQYAPPLPEQVSHRRWEVVGYRLAQKVLCQGHNSLADPPAAQSTLTGPASPKVGSSSSMRVPFPVRFSTLTTMGEDWAAVASASAALMARSGPLSGNATSPGR